MDDLCSLGFPIETIQRITPIFENLGTRFEAAVVNAVLSTENVLTLAGLNLE